MAKVKTQASGSLHRERPKKKRRGVHAKTKSSRSKRSPLYVKRSVGQG